VVEGSENLDLYDICRVDDDTLWCVGHNGLIIRSTDGGDSWESKTKPEFAGLKLRGCYFENAHSGWVVGWEKILFTSDGGQIWIEQAHVPLVKLESVDFVDPHKGWVVGSKETIFHTNDRGADWSCQYSGGGLVELRGVDFVDSLSGWVVGTGGNALCTTDGGANWTRRDLPSSYFLFGVEFTDSLHGWIVGSDGTILHTSDFGANWTPQGSFVNHLFGLDFADTLIGWASGDGVIVKTTDGGQSWSPGYQADTWNLFSVVATIDGTSHPGRQVLLTAHYDAMSEDPYILAPGADDNGSGTVSLLAAASILKDHRFVNTIKFVSFAAEEVGLDGSATYAQEAYDRGDTILGVLNFDMIAYDGNGDGVIHMYCDTALENQALADMLIEVISDYGLNLSPMKFNQHTGGDQTSFWDYGFPAVMVIEDYTSDFNPHYHTTGDRVSAFDTAYFVEFTKAAVAGIATFADPFIVGDVNGDGVIDPSDVVYLINYFFRNGAAPDPLEAGDCNCDGSVEPGDVVYLINYLFRNGDPPDCP
jgi:photosystem II stability/assembly factor-like uncharacterized protein